MNHPIPAPAWTRSAAIEQLAEDLEGLPTDLIITIDGVKRAVNVDLVGVVTHADVAKRIESAIGGGAKVFFDSDFDAIVIVGVASSIKCEGTLADTLRLNYASSN